MISFKPQYWKATKDKGKKRIAGSFLAFLQVFMLIMGMYLTYAPPITVKATDYDENQINFSRTIYFDMDYGSTTIEYWSYVDHDGGDYNSGTWLRGLAIGSELTDKNGVLHIVEDKGSEVIDESWMAGINGQPFSNWNLNTHLDCIGSTPFLRIETPSREGYNFVGWQTDFVIGSFEGWKNGDGSEYFTDPDDGHYWMFDIGCWSGKIDGNVTDVTIRALWEPISPQTEMVDVNCYYLNENNEWVYEISNFSHVQVSHNNSDWARDDNFNVVWNSNYTLFAKPDEGWSIYGWADTPSKGWEELSGKQIEESSLFHKSDSLSWTGFMDTEEPGNYGTTETITVFIIPGAHVLDLNAMYYETSYDSLKNFGTCDLYINGQCVATNISDWYQSYPEGTTYEFKNFKMDGYYAFSDTGILKGTIGNSDIDARVHIYNRLVLNYYDTDTDETSDFYDAIHLDSDNVVSNNSLSKQNYTFNGWVSGKNKYNSNDLIKYYDNKQGIAVIRNMIDDRVCDITGGNNSDGTNIQLWYLNTDMSERYDAQTWGLLWSTDGYFFIVSSATGRFLGVSDDKDVWGITNVTLQNLDWSEKQQWKFIPAGDGYYYIQSRYDNNLVLDAQGGRVNGQNKNGQNVCVYPKNYTEGQKWKLDYYNRDTYFKADWTPTNYTISYNLNGGSASNPTSYNIESDTFTLSNPTRTGYIFAGWTGSNGSTKQTSVSIVKGSYGNKSYTANWTPVNYSISYNLNGGSASNPTSYSIESNTFTLNNPTKTGYSFIGWTGSNGSTKQISVSIVKGSYGNKSYTANWTPTNYTISYNLNGGSASNPTSYNIESDTFTLSNPTRTGYIFAGWTGSNGSTKQTSVNIVKGSYGDKSYTANWTPIKYSITYILNGGSASNPTSYSIESNTFTLNNPTKTGYSFIGWTGSNGSTKQISVSIVKGSYGNKSYTANWTPVNYSISYNLNGGSTSNPTSYNIESDSFTLNIPSKNAYTFLGWTGNNGNIPQKVVSIKKGSMGNKSYTANWTPTNYTISYNLNGGSASNPDSYNIESNTFSLSNPTRTGYIFAGWTGSNGSTKQISVSIVKGSYGNKSYTANWTPVNYSISYNLNGGSASNPASYNIESDTFTLNNPKKNGYTFIGWTGSNGNINQINVTIQKGSINNKSYEAHWSPNNYKIIFNYNKPANATGNVITGDNSKEMIYDATIGTLPNATLTGWSFDGWYFDDGTKLTGSEICKFTSDITVTAHWTPNTYTVRVKADKPATASNSINALGNVRGWTYENGTYKTTFTYDAENYLPESKQFFSLKGWTAVNWNINEYGTCRWNLSSNQDGEVIISALFKENKYTIHFDTEGGTLQNSILAGYEDTISMPPIPFRPGYSFVEWNTMENGSGNRYSSSATVKQLVDNDNGNYYLYAMWQKKKTTTLNLTDSLGTINSQFAENIDSKWMKTYNDQERNVIQSWNVTKNGFSINN